MSYASVMVYIEADATPEERVCLAASVAAKFNAMLIGVSALAVPPPMVANGMVMVELTDADVELMRANLADKGDWFRSIAASNQRPLEWRPVLDLRSRRSHARRGAPILSSSGTPLLADFLEEGLSLLGRSCEEFEIDRL